MTYIFRCPKCNEEVEIECKADDYETVRDSLMCEDCECKLERVFTPWSVGGSLGAYDTVGGRASWENS